MFATQKALCDQELVGAQWGNVCPARYFSINYPDFSPRFTLPCYLPTPGVTMMHHATKRGFKDCPGFLNSTGRLGPKRGRKCYVTPAFSGVPNKGDKIRSQNLR